MGESRVSATTFSVSTIFWIILTALIASAMGGYLAGRLRTRWLQVDRDEVQFRDTAHGFLAWAVAVLVTAALLTSAIGPIISGGFGGGGRRHDGGGRHGRRCDGGRVRNGPV